MEASNTFNEFVALLQDKVHYLVCCLSSLKSLHPFESSPTIARSFFVNRLASRFWNVRNLYIDGRLFIPGRGPASTSSVAYVTTKSGFEDNHVDSYHSSDAGMAALEEGFSKLEKLSLLWCGENSGFDDMDSIYASPEDFKNMKRRDRIRGLHLLEYFVNRCHQIGVACEAWMKHGDPKEVICREVVQVRPDFLVVGSRGLGPFQKVFVGAVSEFCVKHAECPVITIKRKANETPQDPVDD